MIGGSKGALGGVVGRNSWSGRFGDLCPGEDMAELHLITYTSLPQCLQGTHLGFSLRPLVKRELVSIEDRLFSQGEPTRIPDGSFTITFPNESASLGQS
jgi:hypothetical protein